MNRNKLLGKIKENGFTIETVAHLTGMSLSTLSRKLNGHVEFTRDEINAISDALKMSNEDLLDIFFNEKVS